MRVHQFGGGRPRRRPGTAQPPGQDQAPSFGSAISNLLPLLFLFILPLLSSLFSSTSSSGPSFSFTPQPPHTCAHTSANLDIKYFVPPSVCSEFGSAKKNWRALDKRAEESYVHTLNVRCQNEQYKRGRMEQDAQGWFFVDEGKMEEARRMPMPSCEEIRRRGLRGLY